MILLSFLVLLRITLVFCEQQSLAVGRFFNPANAPDETRPFSENVVWKTGDVQTIKFTTTYSNYTIALWQQNLEGGFALLGPVIFQTTTGAFPQFEWAVQTFDLDPSFSSVFFLWLHAGSSSDQGKAQPLSVTSSFFNITLAADSNSSSTISTISSNIATSSTTILASPSITIATAKTSTTTAVDPVSGSESSAQLTGLSQGAKVGVGVGVALVTLFSAIAVILLCLRSQKASKSGNNNAKRDIPRPNVSGDSIGIHKETKDEIPVELYGQEVNRSQVHTVNRYPAELS